MFVLLHIATASLQWNVPPRVPAWPPGYPVINLGMPKCGSSSLHAFMACNNMTDLHYKASKFVATGFRRCKALGITAALSCVVEDEGMFESVSQMDGPRWEESAPGFLFPQISNLADLLSDYPGATFLMMVRNASRWATSIENWWPHRKLANIVYDFSVHDRSSPYYMKNSTSDELARFYDMHTARVIRMSNAKQTKLHIVPLGKDSGVLLTRVLRKLGRSASAHCWQHKNPTGVGGSPGTTTP
jgi:hypothetical protein